jgi:5-methylcytosine-specific restriction enzyme A
MPLLYYWRGDNYRRDLDEGASYHLNQGNPALHDVELGESLWAFTRRIDGRYVLAAELVVKAKTLNPPGYRYGPFRIWGDLGRSRYFCVEGQEDISPLVRGLSIKAGGDSLGRAFQGHAAVRRLDARDDKLLRSVSTALPIESRSLLIPEERLESLLHTGDDSSVARLVAREMLGLSEERRQYLATESPKRNRLFAEELREVYSGRCQICSWEPRLIYGTDVCEAHHVRWLGRGGQDALTNLVLLCPNHHRVIHKVDAPFDWAKMGFVLGSRIEQLTHIEHDLQAN